MDQWLPNLSESSGLHRCQGPVDLGFSKHAFREVPIGFRRGTVRGASLVPPRCPENSQKKVQRSVPGTSPEGTLALQGFCCEVLPRVCRSVHRSGRHREGQWEGVELLQDLHTGTGFLRTLPPLLKKPPPPPFLKKPPTSSKSPY